MPAINPPIAKAPTYTIADSKAFVVNSLIDVSPDNARSFTVLYPSSAAGIKIVLLRVDDTDISIDLTALATVNGNTTKVIEGRDITATLIPADDLTQINC